MESVAEKTARLRALRLARDATQPPAKSRPPRESAADRRLRRNAAAFLDALRPIDRVRAAEILGRVL